MTFERLIRFENDEGKVVYGDIPADIDIAKVEGASVNVVEGDVESGFTTTSRKTIVKKLLCPLENTNIILCVGLNYGAHAKEAKLELATYPVIFTKPTDSLAGPQDDVHIHPEVQKQMDYEGEMTVVIGRDAKNISVEEALDYVLGYTVGNDFSARDFQVPAKVGGGQFSYAKSFDQFAPIGPCILSAALVPDPQKLDLITRVNGEVRQKTSTEDMIWSTAQIIHHLARGTTLRKGTVIMTGTPAGVGLWCEPKLFLRDKDVVEVEIGGIGIISNKIIFD